MGAAGAAMGAAVAAMGVPPAVAHSVVRAEAVGGALHPLELS